ncbi:cyclic nucleotide-binding domain-containing protein [Paraflavitalea sp. CAU 1676]|uniref:Crp/Fnr family transcriptional regulator n=1 Tax=Paraflavitalea sp. CAU 1676 TaxID=3032598 RepID=UPI0023DBFF9E|nr:cyclic nucleotide-binding domain-containing protein [Paraflavitalea sp. CAU 1676]MDF2188703.1 cyclic nucleotide-binding domain-containing protein [Paraflavitalea sp. CAU 1676]
MPTKSLHSYNSKVGVAIKTDFVFHLPQLSKKAQLFIKERSYPLIVKKREVLIKEGEPSNCLFYVRDGALREYVTVDKVQYTTKLIGETDTSPHFLDFYFCQPIKCTVEVAANSIVDVIHRKDIYDLVTTHSINYNSVQELAELMIPKKLELSILLRWHAIKRFEYFQQHHGHLVDLVPHRHIASFLGMASETFSRMNSRYQRKDNCQ